VIQVTVNGKAHSFGHSLNVGELLEQL